MVISSSVMDAVRPRREKPMGEEEHQPKHDDGDDGGADGHSSSDDSSKEEFDFIESTWEDKVETGLILKWPAGGTWNSSQQQGQEQQQQQQQRRRRHIHLSTKLSEDSIAPLFDGTQWAGTRVWKAAVVALEYLLQTYSIGGENKANEDGNHGNDDDDDDDGGGGGGGGVSMLELGCGLGVPAMLWHLLQEPPDGNLKEENDNTESTEHHSLPARVVLTDMPDLLPQLKSNVQANFEAFYGRSIEAKALDWSTQGLQDLWKEELELRQEQQEQQLLSSSTTTSRTTTVTPKTTDQLLFDICLNCDCIYEPLYGRGAWESLADVLAEVARLSPSTVLVTSVERRKGDGLEEFLQRLEGTGTVQCPIQRVLRNDDDPHHVIEIYVTKGILTEQNNN